MLSAKFDRQARPNHVRFQALGSGGYDGGKYEKQRQPGEHDNLLNAAGIEFA
jgi:hypothetical protein